MAENAEISESELLLEILMLGTFVNTPMLDGVCNPNGIGMNELKILMALEGTGVMAGHDLVEVIGMAPMNVSRALQQLRERGWIEDAPDSGNRRRKPVCLSAEGKAAYVHLAPTFDSVAFALVGSLTANQRKQFKNLSRRVLANMAEWITSHHSEIQWRV
jgi:DNA-binding MarR family transcriptional regulator